MIIANKLYAAAEGIIKPLRDGSIDVDNKAEVNPYLLAELRDVPELIAYLDPDFKARDKIQMVIASTLWRYIKPSKRAKLWGILGGDKVKSKDLPPQPGDDNPVGPGSRVTMGELFGRKKPKKKTPEVPTLEIQSPIGNPMMWGKTYGDNVPIIQISFATNELPRVSRFLKSLGLRIVDEQST